ncbi:hypothetical protein AB0G79_10105 [Streptomyces sp. NPDC020807]|uniref:hypothetical protein n=1 Tax=Streptomyces sp. NPDC020807 TaxID=3155119 RepID=UPI0033F29A4C
MTATDPGGPGADEELARHVARLTDEDRRHDRRLLWWELLAVLAVAALLTARALWLT